MAARVRALVVDDEPPLVQVICGYLAREGFEVLSAGDGESAVALARERRPDVVVLDLMLPGIDGMEVCRQLRTFSDAYVIMLTARGDEVDKLVGLSVGADDYLTKPFSPRERSEEHTSELQSHHDLVCRLLLEKKKQNKFTSSH